MYSESFDFIKQQIFILFKVPEKTDKLPIIQSEVSDIKNSQTNLIDNLQKLEEKINNISNVLTKLQNSTSKNLTNAAVNELEERVSKLLSHDNKTNLHDNLKQNQDSKLPILDQKMEIDIQLTDLRGNEKDMSNIQCRICKINDRPHELKMHNSSEDLLQPRITTRTVSQNGLTKEKVQVCPKGAYTKIENHMRKSNFVITCEGFFKF